MSDDSLISNPAAAPKRRELSAWQVAVIAVLAVLFLYFTSQVVGVLLVGLYGALQHWNTARIDDWLTNSVEAQFAYGLLANGVLLLGVALIMRWFNWGLGTIGLTRPKVWHVFLGAIMAVPYYIVYVVIVVILGIIFPELNINQKQDIGFQSVHGIVALGLTFVSLVIIPPLAEELTMRGFLYTGLRRWLPKVVAALAVSVLFGAAHLAEGGDAGPLWIGAIDTFTLSLFLVGLREKTGNLWAGITLHAVKNSVAFVTLFLVAGR